MSISLTNNRTDGKAIWLGADNFYVKYNGFMHAVSGDIGGWSISDTALTSPDKKTILTAGNDSEDSNITTTAITIKDTKIIENPETGKITTDFINGSIGAIQASNDFGLGITSATDKIILESAKPVRVSGSQIFLQPGGSGNIYFAISKDNDLTGADGKKEY
jgi:hypothetical protein